MRFILILTAICIIAGLLAGKYSTDKLTRFCLFTPVKVLFLSMIFALLLWMVSDHFFKDVFTKAYFVINGKELLFYPLFVSFLYSVSSYCIFFCKIKTVRYNNYLSFSCFFVVPFIIVNLFIRNQAGISHLQSLYYFLAFLIPQFYYYAYFLRKQQKGDWDY